MLYIQAFLTALSCMTAAYVLSKILKEIAIVDVFWGLSGAAIAVFLLSSNQSSQLLRTFAALLPIIWGARLALHLMARIAWQRFQRISDWRYDVLTKDWQTARELQLYLKVFGLQSVLITVVLVPLIWLFDTAQSSLYLWGFFVWMFGFLYESVADYQLLQFKKTHKKGEVCDRGLWKYSQHPNYFGELLCWWGLYFLIGGPWWTLVSPVLVTVLLIGVSGIAFHKRKPHRSEQRKEYAAKTPLLIPFVKL